MVGGWVGKDPQTNRVNADGMYSVPDIAQLQDRLAWPEVIIPKQSIEFPNTNSALQIPVANINIGNGTDLGCSVWMFTASGGVQEQVIIDGANAGGTKFRLTFATDTSVRTSVQTTSGNQNLISIPGLITLNAWNHIYYRHETFGNRELFINGVLQETNTAAALNFNPVIGFNYFVGNRFVLSGAEFKGQIFQLALFNGTGGLPLIGDVWENAPVDVTNLSGLTSLLDVSGGAVTNDFVLGDATWTNTNGVIADNNVPT